MRQATLKLKMYAANANTMTDNLEVRRSILRAMALILGGLILLYVLILGSMVFNIVARKSMEKDMLSLTNDVGGLELSYLNLSKNVDMTLSSSMGFKEAKATFATRKNLGSLKIANNEI